MEIEQVFKNSLQSFSEKYFLNPNPRFEIQILEKLPYRISKLSQIILRLCIWNPRYEGSVTFGSYPSWDHNYYETKLTIEASNDKIAQKVLNEVNETMDVIEFDEFPFVKSSSKIESLLSKSEDQNFVQQVKNSQEIIQKCFNEYDMDQVAIAFNGGKDSMVLLHLIFIFIQENLTKKGHNKLQALYIRDSDPFPQVEEFIDGCKVIHTGTNS